MIKQKEHIYSVEGLPFVRFIPQNVSQSTEILYNGDSLTKLLQRIFSLILCSMFQRKTSNKKSYN